MGIAGHDQVGVAVYGQFGKFIVRGITAGSDALLDRHQPAAVISFRSQACASAGINEAR